MIRVSVVPDIIYRTSTEMTLTLDEDDFIDYWREEYDEDDISYVIFEEEPDYGALYTSSLYTEVDYGDDAFYFTGSGIRLKSVIYEPTSLSGTGYEVVIPFTIYGADTDEHLAGHMMIVVYEDLVFTDVDTDDYYYEAVLWAVNEGITTGITSTTFSPGSTCTRAQVVTFLWRAAGEPEPSTAYMPFTDVDEDDYYYDAVLWAVEEDITTGTSSTTFSPNATVTRGQVAAFLWRSQGEVSANTSNPFVDADSDDYYYEAVLWAVENEITTGITSTTFEPETGCTRGQIVTFLYRTYQ